MFVSIRRFLPVERFINLSRKYDSCEMKLLSPEFDLRLNPKVSIGNFLIVYIKYPSSISSSLSHPFLKDSL